MVLFPKASLCINIGIKSEFLNAVGKLGPLMVQPDRFLVNFYPSSCQIGVDFFVGNNVYPSTNTNMCPISAKHWSELAQPLLPLIFLKSYFLFH